MEYRITIGGRIGWLHASLPLGSVRVSPERLTVSLPFRKVSFTPQEVISLELYRPFPYLLDHVRVNHRKPGVPKVIYFTNWDGAAHLLNEITRRGFQPKGGGK